MNSVPLIQNVDKDSINTTIIALKKAINEIESVLGLDSGSEIDTSVFVKKSEVVDAVEADNLNPVTSNAVAEYTVDRIEVSESRPVSSNAVYEAISNIDLTGRLRILRGVVPHSYFNYREIPAFAPYAGNTQGLLMLNNQTPSGYSAIYFVQYKDGTINTAWKLAGNINVSATNTGGTLALDINVTNYQAELLLIYPPS